MTWATRKPLQAGGLPEGGVSLRRTLGPFSLTLIGVGSAIGAGIFVMTGTIAAQFAGPAVWLSFLLAAAVCFPAALCYAEFAALSPGSGSAYSYAYASFGKLAAWTVGWCLVLEYAVSASTIAVGWTGYLNDFLAGIGLPIPSAYASAPIAMDESGTLVRSGAVVNLPAAAIVLACVGMLMRNVRESAVFNNLMAGTKVAAIALLIGVGAGSVRAVNLAPLVPAPQDGHFGWRGIVSGAAVAFFAYTSFEAVSTATPEARRPHRDVPWAILAALTICTVLYVGAAIVVVGLAPYQTLATASPLNTALLAGGAATAWLIPVISASAIVGLGSAILACLYGQSRISLAMAHDGLLPPLFAVLHPRHQVPRRGTLLIGVTAAAAAAILPIDVLGELVSLGTLLAFFIVCCGIPVMRRLGPPAVGGFRVPFSPALPLVGAACCLLLMLSLPAATWKNLVWWLAAGAVLYLVYGRRRGAGHG